MAKMGGVNEHLGGMHVGDNGKSGSFPNSATQRGSLSKGGVNKDLGGGWAPSETDSQAGDLGPGQASDGNPGRQSTAGKSKGAIQRG
jgi:hypothetical protein